MYKYIVLLLLPLLICCENSTDNPRELIIEDLPFHKVETEKEYADLILRAIRTNRDKAIAQELAINNIQVDLAKLDYSINAYSSGIGGREDWQYYDVYEFNNSSDQTRGFDYMWLDPEGRVGIHIYILPEKKEKEIYLTKLEFRSRLEIFESRAFPGGDIQSYKKVNMKW